MAKGGGFFKGEKKKQKKGKDKMMTGTSSYNPVSFTMPEVISKKKKNTSW
ncbi:MAG: hypothetical protein HZC02_01175 [Candidatus Levybacteria bacterium]|nr:hypothetical protein [Candidatus Levybacteria bacterium]